MATVENKALSLVEQLPRYKIVRKETGSMRIERVTEVEDTYLKFSDVALGLKRLLSQ